MPKSIFDNVFGYTDRFGTVTTPETTKSLGGFSPKDYKNVEDPSIYDNSDVLTQLNARHQPMVEKMTNAGKNFGTNFASSFAQGVANLLDVTAWGNDDYTSNLFGYSTKDMAQWAMDANSKRRVLEENPGSFSPGDASWLYNQISQAGTGLGMAALSALETVAIEGLTFGTGTGVALARLGNALKKIGTIGKGGEALTATVNATRGMRSAATIFGIVNRLNEGRMESSQSFQDIFNQLSSEKNDDGTDKYTEEEKREIAAKGADITWKWNMALVPLDILSYRAMVFNPVSGKAAGGIVERGLERVGKLFGESTVGKAMGWTAAKALGTIPEGLEEGFQFIGQREGEHYAKVLGGIERGSTFLDRLGRNVKEEEFWNSVAGGIIGAPVMGGAMNAANYILGNRSRSRVNDIHSDFVSNVGKMDSSTANMIKELEADGRIKEADALRRQFVSNKALSALHLDALTDKDTAFSNLETFIGGVNEELLQGKTDALKDFSITVDASDTQAMSKLQSDFKQFQEDITRMKDVYDIAKEYYAPNILTSVVNTKYNVEKHTSDLAKLNSEINNSLGKISEYNQLSDNGKKLFEIKSELPSLEAHVRDLKKIQETVEDNQEKENYSKTISQLQGQIAGHIRTLTELNEDKKYTSEQRELDNELTESIVGIEGYRGQINKRNSLETLISINRKQAALYNNKEYVKKQNKKTVKNGSITKAKDVIAENPSDSNLKEEVQEKVVRQDSDEALALMQVNPPTVSDMSEEPELFSFEDDDLFSMDENTVKEFDNIMNLASVDASDISDPENDVLGDSLKSLSPKKIRELSKQDTDRLVNSIDAIMGSLSGDKQTFEDLLRTFVKVRGRDAADASFNTLVQGWESSGRSPVDYQDVYSRVFQTVENALNEIINITDANEVRNIGDSLEKEVVKQPGVLPVGTNDNNQIVTIPVENPGEDSTDLPIYSTLAFTNRLGKWVVNSNNKVEWKESSDDLVFGQYIDSRVLLDPDRFREGTELVAKRPTNYRDILVPIFDEVTGEKIDAIPFGQWMAERGIEEGSQQWIDKIPIIVYEKNKSDESKGVAFIHDSDWYHIFNKHGNTPAISLEKQKETRKIRNAVLSSSSKSAELVIRFKTETTIRDLRVPNGGTIPISEGNPQTVFVKGAANSKLHLSKLPQFADAKFIPPGSSPIENGYYYGVVRYGLQDGKKTYLIQKIFQPILGNIPGALKNLENFGKLLVGYNNPANKQAYADIKANTGLDVLKAPGVTNFLKQYINVFDTSGAKSLSDVIAQVNNGNNNYSPGTRVVVVMASGRVVFGEKGGNFKELTSEARAIEFADFVKGMKHNIGDIVLNDARANPRNKMVNITKETDKPFVIEPTKNYNEYLKDVVHTNLRSINIGTAQEPNYVSQVQPSIGISLKDDTKVEPVTVEGTIKKIEKEIAPKEVPESVDDLDKLLQEGLDLLGGEIGGVFSASPIMSQETRDEIAKSIDTIIGLEHYEQTAIKEYIYQHVIKNLSEGELTEEQLRTTIKGLMDGVFSKMKDASITKARQIEGAIEGKELPIEKMDTVRAVVTGLYTQADKYDLVLGSYDILFKTVLDETKKNELVTGSVLQKEIEDDPESEMYEDYSDTDQDTPSSSDFTTNSLRVNPQKKITAKLRFFFEGLPKLDEKGDNVKVLGLDTFLSSGEVLRFLQLSLINTPPSISEIIRKLESIKDARPWIPSVINRIQQAPNQIQVSLIRAVTNTGLKPKMAMYSFRNNNWHVELFESHLNGVENVIYRDWSSTFFTKSGIVEHTNGVYRINEDKKNELKSKFNALKNMDNSDSTVDHIMELLSQIGITVSRKTIDKIRQEGFKYNYKKMTWQELFTEKGGLFRIIADELGKYNINSINNSETIITKNTVFKALAKEDANYSLKYNSLNFRDNGKSFFGLITPKYITDRALSLVNPNDSSLREKLAKNAFSQQSFILKLLSESSKFREQFSIDNVADTAIKELGKSTFTDMSMEKISPLDHELTKIAGFTYRKQGEVSYDSGLTDYNTEVRLKMRIASMFAPTMADKGMPMWVKTAVLELGIDDLGAGKQVSDDLMQVLYEQLVRPDLLRMFDSRGKHEDIAGYSKGKSLFMLIPSMNSIKFNDTLLLKDHIRNNGNALNFTIADIEKNQEIMRAIKSELNRIILSEKDKKVEEWIKSGLVTETKVPGNYDLTTLDSSYMEKFTGSGISSADKLNMFAMDYTINNIVHNANMSMLVSGDPALYFKSKEKSDFMQMAMDSYDNMNKRLALLIAPATPYPNGVGESYRQIFMQDRTSLPDKDFLKFLTKMEDGRGLSDEEYNTLQSDDEDGKKAIAKKFPSASPFFNIEGTDAQEYTTWKEHLNILQRYGNLSDETVNITQKEIDEARKIFTENIDRDKLTKGQLEVISKVMQPIKPRYVGMYNDGNMERMIYIKTSSFPLVPQLTKGFEIDKLRVMMQDYENRTGKNIRASYESGNKIGSFTNPLQVWNSDGTFRKKAVAEIYADNAPVLELDRSGWGIQQDVPFKSEKPGEDKIRLGTQLMKLLFGDNIMMADGFMYKGKPYTGTQLKEMYDDLFSSMLSLKQDDFNRKMGLNAFGNITDPLRTAKKLQKSLKDEAVRRGYPLSDVAGLELDSDGNFVMPLWGSNNVHRYESLLNSIVDNALVKIKFPGYSYVAGSSEGFRSPTIIEEQDFKDSEIIYTKHWNGSKLQMTHTKDGKLQKAQVFLPSKFKDSDGNLIDLFQRKNGQYVYLNAEGTKLKDDMIDDDLLKILSFRIPTSSIGSAATVEIAGFIPYGSGDLIIVPSEFTKQKGMDFDVDKEFTYHLWNVVDEDGRIRSVNKLYSEKNTDEVLEELNEVRVELMKEAKKVASIQKQIDDIEADVAKIDMLSETVKAYSGAESETMRLKTMASNFKEKMGEHSPEDIQNMLRQTLEEIARVESHKLKSIQNDLIELMHSVMENPSNEVQSKINKALSIEYGKGQAEMIDKLVPKDKSTFTGLSDMYQKEQFLNGVSGKTGTGAYSLDVVLHSLAQQLKYQGKPIQINAVEESDEGLVLTPKIWKFGKRYELYSNLGEQLTVDGNRSITDVNSERQNQSVDNGKEKILGKVNVHSLTMDVDKVFNLLGSDMITDDRTELGKLSDIFLSQPILRDYVEAMQNVKSIIAEYVPDKEMQVIKSLIAKYYPEGVTMELNKEYWESAEQIFLDPDNLINELSTGGTGQTQFAVLMRFLDMRGYGISIRAAQVAINTDSKGLGKSFQEVIEKLNTVSTLDRGSAITGMEKLIGDYYKIDKLTQEQIDLIKREQHVVSPDGEKIIVPKTISGKIGLVALNTAYNLYRNFLPYDSNRFKQLYEEILPVAQSDNPSETATVQLKHEVLKHIKKFFAAMPGNGIVEGNLKRERARLMIDSPENTSLAKYLKELMSMEDNPVVTKFIKNNILLSRFEPEINIDGTPSIIKYNNAVGEDFNEQELYNAFSYLLSNSHELPKIGNKKYTTDTLAQELINYAHIGNATQEAIQFTKFIPTKYYHIVGYTKFMRELHGNFINNTDDVNIFGFNADMPSKFTTQFFQHNPERVRFKLPNKLTELGQYIADTNKEFKGDLKDLNSFSLKSEDKPKFITVYNKGLKGKKKQQLYVRMDNVYVRIPILGTFGMDEYDPANNIGETIVNDPVPVKLTMDRTEINEQKEGVTDVFNISSGNTNIVLNNIAFSGDDMLNRVAGLLATKVKNIPIEFRRTTNGGEYIHDEHKIYMAENIYDKTTTADVAKILVHEAVHGLTVHQIKPYLKTVRAGVYELKEGAPNYVGQILQLYNIAREGKDEQALNKLKDDARKGRGFTTKEFMDYYVSDIFEFMSGIVSDVDFQNLLKDTPFMQSGKTLWDRFIEVLKNVLEAAGIDFNQNGITANALSNIMELIENEGTKNVPKNIQSEIDEINTVLNQDPFEDLPDFGDPFEGYTFDDPDGSASPKTLTDGFIRTLDPSQIKCE